MTVSSGVLINNLIDFTPPLPSWKKDTINLMPMTHYCKFFLKFTRRFWDGTNYIFFAQKVRGDRVHWQNFDQPTLLKGQHILMLTLTEDLCLRADKMNDKDVIKEAMESLKKVYGQSIPPPTGMKSFIVMCSLSIQHCRISLSVLRRAISNIMLVFGLAVLWRHRCLTWTENRNVPVRERLYDLFLE